MTIARRRGMTLLEVIVALTIAGAALAAGATVLGFLTDQQARQVSASLTKPASIRTSVHAWLAGAVLSTQGTQRFSGLRQGPAGQRVNSSLDFVTSAATPVAGGGDALTRVRLFVRHDPGDATAYLAAELSALPRGATTTLTIADSVTAFDVRYLGSVFAGSRWADAWSSASVLPAVAWLRIGTSSDPLLAMPMTVIIGERR